MKYFILGLLLVSTSRIVYAQNVGIGTATPNSSAMLEINSSSKGLLLPRVADTSSVTAPAKGLLVYSTNNNKLWYFDGNHWQQTVSNAGGMDSIWYKTQDSLVYTSKPYVGINTDLTAYPAQANLELNGSFLVEGGHTFSNSAPTASQIYTMGNSGNQTINSADSVFRLYDPGGTRNYTNNISFSFGTNSIMPQSSLKISSAAADFGFGTGDTLWISAVDFPQCRTNYDYRFTAGSANPPDLLLGDIPNIIFRSNADGSNGKGFNFTCTRIYGKPGGKRPLVGFETAMLFDPGSGAFSVGYENSTDDNGTAFGEFSDAGSYSFAAGQFATANGQASAAFGNSTIASGTYSMSSGYHNSAAGDHSVALNSHTSAQGDDALSVGTQTIAAGFGSLAAGNSSQANGSYSLAAGQSTAAGDYSNAFGDGVTNNGYSATVVGMNNQPVLAFPQHIVGPATPLFIVGNGDGSSLSNAMVVLKNGNTGLGDNSPDERLDVNGNIIMDNTDGIFQLKAAGISKGFIQLNGDDLRLGTNSTNSNGNLVFRLSGGDRFTLLPNGNATLSGTLTQNSDLRLKDHIVPINDALSKIMRLTGYTYHWKTGLSRDNNTQIGLLAQNVETVLPQLVATDKEGIKSVAYQNMVPVLIEAIKEQQKQIEKQQKQINELLKRRRH